MHYYGDIDPQNVIQQTQVLNPWWLMPMNLFCANFGGTHAIHHFVINEPFYIRHLTAHMVYPIMKEVGVRFNDFGTFSRLNRWGAYPSSSSSLSPSPIATTLSIDQTSSTTHSSPFLTSYSSASNTNPMPTSIIRDYISSNSMMIESAA
jgi:hypothetical protein